MNKRTMDTYLIRLCTNQTCNLRFPAPESSGIGILCPKCKAVTKIVRVIKLNQDAHVQNPVFAHLGSLEIVLDNVRSTFNVGAIFRTADGAGIGKIHLCGITPAPTNAKVHKTALGAQNSMPYEMHHNSLDLIKQLKQDGKRIWALEKTETSQNIQEFKIEPGDQETVLIVGNEIIGIDPEVLAFSDLHLHIPMVGIKGSLNVAIAFGIAVYNLLEIESQLRKRNSDHADL